MWTYDEDKGYYNVPIDDIEAFFAALPQSNVPYEVRITDYTKEDIEEKFEETGAKYPSRLKTLLDGAVDNTNKLYNLNFEEGDTPVECHVDLPNLTNCKGVYGTINSNYADFSHCEELESIRISCPELISTSRTGNSGIFSNCSKLNYVSANLPKATNLEKMFSECTSLNDDIEISAPLATGADNMFSGCTSLKRFDSYNFDFFTNLEDSAYMFYGCTLLEDVSIKGLNINVTHFMFAGCTSLKDVSKMHFPVATLAPGMFEGARFQNEVIYDDSFSSFSFVTNMFSDCGELHISFGDVDLTKFTRTTDMFQDTDVKLHIHGAFDERAQEVYNFISSYPRSPRSVEVIYDSLPVKVKLSALSGYLNSQPQNTPDNPYEINVVEIGNLYSSNIGQIINAAGKYVSLVENVGDYSLSTSVIDGLFQGNIYLVEVSGFDDITSAADCFDGCTNLRKASGFSNLIHADYMFIDSNISDVSGLTLNNIVSAQQMFEDCKSLKTFDMSNMTNLKTMDYMFSGCMSLETITGFNIDLTKMSKGAYKDCFADCPNLRSVSSSLQAAPVKKEWLCWYIDSEKNLYYVDETGTSHSTGKIISGNFSFDGATDEILISDNLEEDCKRMMLTKFPVVNSQEYDTPLKNTFTIWSKNKEDVITNIIPDLEVTDAEFDTIFGG